MVIRYSSVVTSTYLEYRVIPKAVIGFASIEDLVLAGELVVGNILTSHHSPAPPLLGQPAYEQLLCMRNIYTRTAVHNLHAIT